MKKLSEFMDYRHKNPNLYKDQNKTQEVFRMKTTGKEKMNARKGVFAKWYWSGLLLLLPELAQAASANFKTGLGYALGIGALLDFGFCVFFVIEGIYNFRTGGNYGKDIIGLIVCAGAFAIVGVFFSAFGLGSAVVDPTF